MAQDTQQTVSILIGSSKANTRSVAAWPTMARNMPVALIWIKRDAGQRGTGAPGLTCHADVICSSIAQYYHKFLWRY
jgi:hypothetical protein